MVWFVAALRLLTGCAFRLPILPTFLYYAARFVAPMPEMN